MSDFNPDFREWPKTPRLFREIVITEKLDGTNAAIHIERLPDNKLHMADHTRLTYVDGQWYGLAAQSRKRMITPQDDNYGFARWVHENAADLVTILGPGLHFGEWWGQGIQRRYGMDRKMFSLFNTSRWREVDESNTSPELRALDASVGAQIDAVPVLYSGQFDETEIRQQLYYLQLGGSKAAPGFMNPEGICVYHSQTRSVFKVTLDANDAGKWEAA
ncbi:RNA ligase family protein [Streptomyces cyaneofuscatus]